MAGNILIVGASVRAAAASALRAGLSPWCVDLYADADLAAMCPARRLEGKYPEAFEAALAEGPPGPWMYTGGLENYPRLVSRMVKARPLWGNDGDVLRKARDPSALVRAAREAGLPAPALGGGEGRWLAKPRGGAGGGGIRVWGGEPISDKYYLQKFLEGKSVSAVYSGRTLLGVTRQLVGEAWLAAPPFGYCGSVGPIEPLAGMRELGEVLVEAMGLRGLFGVDGIVCDGAFWPVELNPRYTASVEVIERATGVRALAISDASEKRSSIRPVAKGVLYARANVRFPVCPWGDDFADLPHAGDEILAGRPVLTLFADSLAALRRRAAEVEALLFKAV